MLKHAEPARDPFSSFSSSPDRLPVPQPRNRRRYTIKTHTSLYTSVRSTCTPNIQIHFGDASDEVGNDRKRHTRDCGGGSTSSELSRLVNGFCGQLDVAVQQSSSPIRHRNALPPFYSVKPVAASMAKIKPQHVKSLSSGAKLSRRQPPSQGNDAVLEAGKRKMRASEASKALDLASSSSSSSSSKRLTTEKITKTSSAAPSASSSSGCTGLQQPRVRTSTPKSPSSLHIPRIVVRPATPGPSEWFPNLHAEAAVADAPTPPLSDAAEDDSVNQFLPKHRSATSPARSNQMRDNVGGPSVDSTLLAEMEDDLGRLKLDIDTVLLKYLNMRLSTMPHAISNELLRILAAVVCKYNTRHPASSSDSRKHLLELLCTRLFRHIITGLFQLLDDGRAPYNTAKSLSQLCSGMTYELEPYVKHSAQLCSRQGLGRNDLPSGSTHRPIALSYLDLFSRVLQDELQRLLNSGLSLCNKNNKLALPGRGASSAILSVTTQGSNSMDWWSKRDEVRRELARRGQPEDAFVGVDLVRFIGELFNSGCISGSTVKAWIDRFLYYTTHSDIPSAWEIECACALLITIGETVDRMAPCSLDGDQDVSNGDIGKKVSCEEDIRKTLKSSMERVEDLIQFGDISDTAREWLIELRRLRARGWKLYSPTETTGSD